MNRRLSFVAGVIAGMGQARRRIAAVGFLAGVVTGIGLGIGAGMGLGIGLRKKTLKVFSGSHSVNGAAANMPPLVRESSRDPGPTDEAKA
jgi:hypothetical protein